VHHHFSSLLAYIILFSISVSVGFFPAKPGQEAFAFYQARTTTPQRGDVPDRFLFFHGAGSFDS
jgi:hypothetical protein